MNFIKLLECEYKMGADDADIEALEQERPVKNVSINEFFLAEHLTTIAEFKQFIDETGYEPAESALYFDGDDWQMGETLCWNDPGYSYMDETPVTCVNFSDVKQYISWASTRDGLPYRLSTEAEWECAARAGTATARFWGDSIKGGEKYANIKLAIAHENPQFKYASPVGFFLANPWGFYDMLGNVFEWTGSDYSEVFNGDELICSDSDGLKTYRGGSFNSESSIVRCSARSGFPVELASNQIGFRLAY